MENKDDGTGATYIIVIKIYPEKGPNQKDSIYGKLYNIMDDKEILSHFDVIKLTELSLSRNVVVSTELTGVGTLADLGTVPLEFNYEATENYSVDWFDPATKDAK